MRRLILTLAASAAFALPMAAATGAAAQSDHHWRDHDGRSDSDRGNRHGSERHDGDRHGGNHQSEGRRDGDRRWDGGRRGDNDWNRGDRRGGDRRWDDQRFNGYWFNNRWSYGPPPSAYYDSPLFRPGYSGWRRGGYLPEYYSGWAVEDYWRYELRRPPSGYRWVRIGDDYLLVNSRGLIFDIIPGR